VSRIFRAAGQLARVLSLAADARSRAALLACALTGRLASGSKRPRAVHLCRRGRVVTLRLADHHDIDLLDELWVGEGYPLPEGPPPRRVLDLGANIGLFAVDLALRFPHARILAVEPHPATFARLCAHVAPFPGIEPLHGAVWERGGEVAFAARDQHPSARVDGEGTVRVPALTLEELFARLGGGADLVKFDVEGAEAHVLTDPAVLARARAWVGEIHPHLPGCAPGPIVRRFEEAGFEVALRPLAGPCLLLRAVKRVEAVRPAAPVPAQAPSLSPSS